MLKILLWTVMGAVLSLYGIAVCVVRMIEPRHLTELCVHIAGQQLDAGVEMGMVRLSLTDSGTLKLEIDSLTVRPNMMAAYRPDAAVALPVYADTLIALDRFEGELRLHALLSGRLDIKNVELSGPRINLVTVNDSLNNFSIFPGDPDTDDKEGTPGLIETVSLDRFSVRGENCFRYVNMRSGDSIAVGLNTLLRKEDGGNFYSLSFEGDVASPVLRELSLLHLPVSLNGRVEWNDRNPYTVSLSEFECDVRGVKAGLDVTVDFGDDMIIRSFAVELPSLRWDELSPMIPEHIADEFKTDMIRTDLSVAVSVKSERPFNVTHDTIPYAICHISVPQSYLRYGNARIEKLSAEIAVRLSGNDLDSAVVDVGKLTIAGRATRLDMSGRVSELLSDARFDLRVDGYTDLSKLPPPIASRIKGRVSGTVNAQLETAGRVSMFGRNGFHKLFAEGRLAFSNLYWLDADTANMVWVQKGGVTFGSKRRFGNSGELLSAKVNVDSANILSGGIDVAVKSLSLGVGMANQQPVRDTTVVVPMGGKLKFASLNVNSITDTAGVRLREVEGYVTMRRFQNQRRVPEFVFDLAISRMAAGSLDTRVMFSNSVLHVDAHKTPEVRKQSTAVRQAADSIAREYPDLPPDSVIALAIAHRKAHRSKHHRVHDEITGSGMEVIDWGTSKGLSQLLLKWIINGSLISERANLFTRHFPLRNRLRNLDIQFNNDTVALEEIALKVGHSDFAARGRITNVRRAFTSKRWASSLKIDIDAESDTVDINQIADAVFRGASYSASRASTEHEEVKMVDDELMFEEENGSDMAADTATASPLLIPVNIDADLRFKAANILYSDLLLHDMTGQAMMYGGALNLHDFRASSDIGSVGLSALYCAPTARDMNFGFGLDVKSFDIARFMDLVPAVDSIMPLLRDISGIINADIAATCDIAPDMSLRLPSLAAAIKLQGDSLQLMDANTFRTIAKWLMFKNKKRNIIDRMTVEAVVSDGSMRMFPFIFDIDRYRIGVQGYNDLNLNFDYLISVLKSPLPFKFGITIKGNPEHYKIRVGRAKFDEKMAVERKLIVDTTRINLIDQIERVFRRGVDRSEFGRLRLPAGISPAAGIDLSVDPVTARDSLLFIREGLIPEPVRAEPDSSSETKKKKKK